MAWKRIVQWTKPNNSVDFGFFSPIADQHIYDNYEISNKSKSFVHSYSDDGLIKYHTRIFDNEACRNEFVSDSIILDASDERDVVNTSRGISCSVSFDAEYDGPFLSDEVLAELATLRQQMLATYRSGNAESQE